MMGCKLILECNNLFTKGTEKFILHVTEDGPNIYPLSDNKAKWLTNSLEEIDRFTLGIRNLDRFMDNYGIVGAYIKLPNEDATLKPIFSSPKLLEVLEDRKYNDPRSSVKLAKDLLSRVLDYMPNEDTLKSENSSSLTPSEYIGINSLIIEKQRKKDTRIRINPSELADNYLGLRYLYERKNQKDKKDVALPKKEVNKNNRCSLVMETKFGDKKYYEPKEERFTAYYDRVEYHQRLI